MPAAARSAALVGMERIMLVSLALACSLVACREPDAPTDPSLSQGTLPNSITLTYICGNSFRVRNTNATVVTVTWDVYKTSETGSLTLLPKPASGPYSETYFTTVNKGTVRLFLDGTLIQTKANGNKPVCQLPTVSWPKLGDAIPLPDSTKIVLDPDGGLAYFRTDLKLRFKASTPDNAKSELFSRYGMTVLGEEWTGGFYVRIPDPGPSWTDLQRVLNQLNQESIVDRAMPLMRENSAFTPNARYPSDGDGQKRTDWLSGSTSTWALRAIRAPLAWGCETGTYGGSAPRIGLLEARQNPANPDIAPSSRALRPTDTLGVALTSRYNLHKSSAATLQAFVDHATWTSSLLGASGDNGQGTAGVLWNSRLFLYEAVDPDGYSLPTSAMYRVVGSVLKDSLRVLSISIDQFVPRGTSDSAKKDLIYEASMTFEALLRGASDLTIIIAAGDSAFVGSSDEYETVPQPGIITAALLRLKANYPNRIIFVAGTNSSRGFSSSFPGTPARDGSNFFRGLTDILAPAADVAVQAPSGSMVLASGTSLSAPLVAGVAGQLLAMDPTLTPYDVRRYLIDGASMYREDPSTGDSLPVPPIGGVPGGEDIHQLDAYGSLKLLSYERPGTPLCGLTVRNAGTAWYQVQSVIQRQAGPEAVTVGGQPVAFTSIAQGGRLAASGTEAYRLDGGTWVRAGSAGEDAVVFLEQDTAYLRPVTTSGPLWTRTDLQVRIGSPQPSRRVPATNITQAFPSNLAGAQLYSQSAWYAPELVSVSPTGDWVYLEFMWNFNDDCLARPGEGEEFRRLIPMRGGQMKEFSRRSWSGGCQGPTSLTTTSTAAAGGRVAWSADGQEFYYGREYYDAHTELERWTVAGGVQQTGSGADAGDLRFDALLWSQEGGRLLSREQYLTFDPPGDCMERVRASGDPAILARSLKVGDFYTSCPDVPLAAARLALAPGRRPAPGAPVPSAINRRYPLGIPRSMRAN